MNLEKDRSGYIIILSLCLCNGLIINWSSGFVTGYTWFMRLSLVAGLGMLCPNIRVLLDDKYHSCNILMGLTLISIMTSAVLNRSNYTGSIVVALTNALRFLLLTWYCEYLDLNGETDYGLKSLFIIIFGYCVLSDVLAVVWPHRTYFSWGEHSDSFLVGNKFALSYLHLLGLALYCTVIKGDYENHRKQIVFLIILSYFAAFYSECSTMLVGNTAFLILLVFREKIENVLYNQAFFLVYFVACNLMLIVEQGILQIPVIRYVIEELLHESLDLSSRTRIYSRLGSIMNLSPLFGVGIDNNYVVSLEYTKAADVQNGILDVFLSYGWVGVAILIGLLLYVLYRSRISGQTALLSVLYVYVTLSSVEITLRGEMYTLLLLIILTSWNGAEKEITVQDRLSENTANRLKERTEIP